MESENDLESSGLVQADEQEREETDGETGNVSPSTAHDGVPIDRNRLVYWAFLFAGAAFLFPYNTFITAVDYFQYVYPKQNPESIMTAVYINVTLAFVFVNVMLVDRWSTHARITSGYALFVGSLVAVMLLTVFLRSCDSADAFGMTLVAMSGTAIACGGLAGTIVSINRIVTKSVGSKALRTSTIVYFAISTITMLGGVAVHWFLKQSAFVNYHLHRDVKKLVTPPSCIVKGGRRLSRSSWLGEVEMDSLNGDRTSVNNVHLKRYSRLEDSMTDSPTDTDEDGLRRGSLNESRSHSRRRLHILAQWWSRAKSACSVRWLVARLLWQWLLAIALCYFVTLLLFPALLSKVPQHSIGDWMPVILIAIFNIFDLLGKIVGLHLMSLSIRCLLWSSIVRFLLVPLLLLCLLPCEEPYLDTSYSAVAMATSAVLGITNGVLGTVTMSCAASHVAKQHQEMAGNLMVFACLFGLTIGAYVAVGLDKEICQEACISDKLNLANSTVKSCPLTCLSNSTSLLR